MDHASTRSRYYENAQLERLLRIVELRGPGMELDPIGQILKADDEGTAL